MASYCWKNMYSLISSLKFWKHGVRICSMHIPLSYWIQNEDGSNYSCHTDGTLHSYWGHISTQCIWVLDYLPNSIFHFTWILKYFHLQDKLVMDQLHHYTLFHRISKRKFTVSNDWIFFFLINVNSYDFKQSNFVAVHTD